MSDRAKQHYLIDAAICLLNAHKVYPCRDEFDSCGYRIEQAISVLKNALDMEKQISAGCQIEASIGYVEENNSHL